MDFNFFCKLFKSFFFPFHFMHKRLTNAFLLFSFQFRSFLSLYRQIHFGHFWLLEISYIIRVLSISVKNVRHFQNFDLSSVVCLKSRKKFNFVSCLFLSNKRWLKQIFKKVKYFSTCKRLKRVLRKSSICYKAEGRVCEANVWLKVHCNLTLQ